MPLIYIQNQIPTFLRLPKNFGFDFGHSVAPYHTLEKWQSESFNNSQQGDAECRHDYFYSPNLLQCLNETKTNVSDVIKYTGVIEI
jgi:hypothetical protein